jgi:peptidoglycan L-alanyl-D-glutamate endopeptidase CwlK
MRFILGLKSKLNLRGVHPDLVAVVQNALQRSEVDFTVLEGVRTIQRQKELLKAGATTTLNSRHLTGHAVDLGALVGGKVRWDWSLYLKIAEAMKYASEDLKIPVRWGGSWKLLSEMKTPITSAMLSKSFPDGPHFELYRKRYP